MIHIVNPQTSEILDYITLDNIIEDTHKKSLESYLETYDAIVLGGDDFSYDKHLEKRNHIIIPDEDGTYQEFILFEVEKYRDTEGRKTHFYAHATYLELKKAKVIYPTRREEFTLSQHAGWALNDTGWTVGIVESEGVRTFNIENHTNPYEFLKRLANEFEVEIRFRVEHDGRKITARYVDFLERIGDWKGREVEFGRDLDEIRRIEKQDIVTALLGLGPERDDGTRIEVLVTDDEALQRWGRVDEHGNLHHLIEPYEIQSERQEMTEEEARRYTRTALDKRINTQVTYETTILDLEEVPGLEHEKIRFGDTIRIKDTYFNPPLYLEARVFEMERSIKNKEKKEIKLGDYIEYTEEEVSAIWNQLRNEIRRRLDRIAIVTINSTAGNVFKNAQGETQLTARTFVNGAERDEDGTLYDYQWMRFDKDGNHDTSFYAEGKTITVTANDIDEKATYRVLVAYELEVINTAEITISNVFDGEDGEPGPPGPKGDKGDKGDPGPQGPPGTSITSIVEYYLATDQSSGVTIDTPGWTTTMQQMTPQKRYLWNYERINFSDGTHQNTNPVIIGVYGDEGEEGRSVVNITEYYLATSASSGVTRDTSGWTTTMQVTTPEKKYLWNYEKITWNKAPLETYTEPVIIGVHGEQGPKGDKGEDGQSVEDITIEYYLSTSDSTQTGGTWTETKPTYQPGKYLWIRQKITYKNPTAIEYTTPVLDDSWKAVEIADEAKQEAEEANQTAQQAKTTADGKNTIIPSKTEPPTEGRKIGDVWFQEMPDGSLVIHDFNGVEWVKRQFGEQSIIANSITANHIKSLVGLNVNDQFIVDSQGNVKFAGSLEGATGTFSGDIQGSTITGSTFYATDLDDPEHPNSILISYDSFRKSFNNKIDKQYTEIRIDDSFNLVLYDYSGAYGPWTHLAGTIDLEPFGGLRFYFRDIGTTEYWIYGITFEPATTNELNREFVFDMEEARFTGSLKIGSFSTPLWTGQAYPLDTQTIRPSKRLSDCMTGWILRWQTYTPGTGTSESNFQYTIVPKVHAEFKNGFGMRVPLGATAVNQNVVNKYIYVYNDRIVGHSDNNQYGNQSRALTGVFEF